MNEWKLGSLKPTDGSKFSRHVEPLILKEIENNYREFPYLPGTSKLIFFRAESHEGNNLVSYIFYIDDLDDILVVYIYNHDTENFVGKFYFSTES